MRLHIRTEPATSQYMSMLQSILATRTCWNPAEPNQQSGFSPHGFEVLRISTLEQCKDTVGVGNLLEKSDLTLQRQRPRAPAVQLHLGIDDAPDT